MKWTDTRYPAYVVHPGLLSIVCPGALFIACTGALSMSGHVIHCVSECITHRTSERITHRVSGHGIHHVPHGFCTLHFHGCFTLLILCFIALSNILTLFTNYEVIVVLNYRYPTYPTFKLPVQHHQTLWQLRTPSLSSANHHHLTSLSPSSAVSTTITS
jgi:hypothetical protein